MPRQANRDESELMKFANFIKEKHRLQENIKNDFLLVLSLNVKLIMVLLPPPAGAFESQKALIALAQEWAGSHGYAVIIAHSKPAKVYLQCDKGGRYQNRGQLTDDMRRRRTGSRFTGCPFSIIGISQNSTWILFIRDEKHNHEASAH